MGAEHELASPPVDSRARELWLQHAAGFILFENVRRYATEQIDPALAPDVRSAVEKGIDDALYGLMMLIDGLTGGLSNATQRVELRVLARLVNHEDDSAGFELDLAEGDGMCMGYHDWRKNDFGADPIVAPKSQ